VLAGVGGRSGLALPILPTIVGSAAALQMKDPNSCSGVIPLLIRFSISANGLLKSVEYVNNDRSLFGSDGRNGRVLIKSNLIIVFLWSKELLLT
jgi:hypothetical protein